MSCDFSQALSVLLVLGWLVALVGWLNVRQLKRELHQSEAARTGLLAHTKRLERIVEEHS